MVYKIKSAQNTVKNSLDKRGKKVYTIKTKIKILIFLFAMAFMLTLPLYASDNYTAYADALNTLGLFKGGGNGYELERTTTRAEAITLLVRVLGKEDEALDGKYPHPFTDAGWADAYVGLAYREGLSKGISDTLFGASLPIDHNQYATLLLRALGYSDNSGGQFKYENAYDFAVHKFAMEKYEGEFTRGELVRMTAAALNSPICGESKTLSSRLMSQGVFTQSEYKSAKRKIAGDEKTTAVLIYAVASDLESKLGMLTADIREILDASGDGVEILLQTGGTRSYRHQSLTDGATQRVKITNGEISVIETLTDTKMCEPQTLTDFLNFAKATVTADRYVLVFWDHGDGTLGGFGRDELNGNASLSLYDIKSSLEAYGEKLDLIVFDTCLMGTAECAYALSEFAEYMIASEDITPVDGIYYTTWLNTLAADPTLSNEELSRLIVDSYVIHAPPDREDVTLSVIRLSKAKAFADGIIREMTSLADSMNAGLLLKSEAPKPYGADIGVDQYDALSLFGSAGLNTGELMQDIESMIYYKRSAVPDKYSGIALYMPLTRRGDYSKVRDVLINIGYPKEIISVMDKLN